MNREKAFELLNEARDEADIILEPTKYGCRIKFELHLSKEEMEEFKKRCCEDRVNMDISTERILADLEEFEHFYEYYLENHPEMIEQIAMQERVIKYIKYSVEKGRQNESEMYK